MNIENKTILEILQLGGKETLQAQEFLQNAYKNNTKNFFLNMKAQKFEDAEKNISWGLDWAQETTWRDLESLWRSNCCNIQTINIIWNLKPTLYPSNMESTKWLKVDVNDSPTQIMHKSFIKKLHDGMYSNNANQEGIVWILDKLDIWDANKPKILKNLVNVLSKVDLSSFTEVLDILLQFHPASFMDLIKTQLVEKNFNFLINNSKYNSILQNFLNEELKKTDIMNNSLRDGNLPMLKILHNLNIPYPELKEPYSVLFCSSTKKEAIKYVINTIDDITIGNQVILKSLLHTKIDDMVPLVLTKYNEQQLKELPKVIEKREDSESIALIKKYIFKDELENELEKKVLPKISKKI